MILFVPPDPLAVHCLKCLTVQEDLSGHLRQVCMSGAEEALVLEEVARAFESEGRVVGLAEVRGLVQEDPTCGSLAEYFRAKGFLIAEQPIELRYVGMLAEGEL